MGIKERRKIFKLVLSFPGFVIISFIFVVLYIVFFKWEMF